MINVARMIRHAAKPLNARANIYIRMKSKFVVFLLLINSKNTGSRITA